MTPGGASGNCITGRPVVITGAASGLGAALAEAVGNRGARSVAVVDIDAVGAKRLATRLTASGVMAAAYTCDVSVPAAVMRVADEIIADFGVPGLVCANAGVVAPLSPGLSGEPSDIEWVFAVNVVGLIITLEAFGSAMAEAGETGWLLAVGSDHSIGVPNIGVSSYTASKHAVLGYCDVLRAELPSHLGISVLCPGLMATNLWNAGRNRGNRFGGAAAADEIVRPVMARGLAPADAANIALNGIDDGRFLILTHSATAEIVKSRVEILEKAMEHK